MTTATLDRFGRIVIPRAMRQRHGWRPGTALELRDGPSGIEVVPVSSAAGQAPVGWAWQDGVLVCTAAATADITDVAALRDSLDAQRDQELSGFP
jgi:AbrB family looped-hinge helix DNA binding protein